MYRESPELGAANSSLEGISWRRSMLNGTKMEILITGSGTSRAGVFLLLSFSDALSKQEALYAKASLEKLLESRPECSFDRMAFDILKFIKRFVREPHLNCSVFLSQKEKSAGREVIRYLSNGFGRVLLRCKWNQRFVNLASDLFPVMLHRDFDFNPSEISTAIGEEIQLTTSSDNVYRFDFSER